MNSHFYNLLNNYMLGTASKAEFQELEYILKNDPEACLEYIEYTNLDANLRSFALEVNELPKPKQIPKFPVFLFSAAAALLIVMLSIYYQKPRSAAIVHSLDGKFKSLNSAIVGSELYPGTFEFESGSASLKLHSGADLYLKSPVKFKIVSDMQIKVIKGSLAVFVRESAKGFRVDLPNGYVIDHGTKFSINVLRDNSTRFQVSDGLISVHHNSGQEEFLNAGKSAVMTSKSIKHFITLTTNGEETTVIENPKQILKSAVDPKLLLVKQSGLGFENSRRSIFAFKHTKDNFIESARLILNYLPTGMGNRNTMPEESEFELYGVPDGAKEKWNRNGMDWKEAPKIEELQLLASFIIARKTTSKTVVIESDKLTKFIQEDNNGEFSFLISCKTPGGKMVHGFANSKYGDEEEPKLELFYQKEQAK